MRHQGDWAIPVEATENELSGSISRAIAGALRIVADDTSVRLSNICLTTSDGAVSFEDSVLPADGVYDLGRHEGDF
ncbi:MAG: hypothetical protein II200_09160, partial [Bacteroidaceae bacterium]|nr:hypothetical protein [Bacteroidaceae bacterium]